MAGLILWHKLLPFEGCDVNLPEQLPLQHHNKKYLSYNNSLPFRRNNEMKQNKKAQPSIFPEESRFGDVFSTLNSQSFKAAEPRWAHAAHASCCAVRALSSLRAQQTPCHQSQSHDRVGFSKHPPPRLPSCSGDPLLPPLPCPAQLHRVSQGASSSFLSLSSHCRQGTLGDTSFIKIGKMGHAPYRSSCEGMHTLGDPLVREGCMPTLA